MKTSIVKIGNSQGVRIPKALLGNSQIGDSVEIQPSGRDLMLRFATQPRAGWAEAAARMAAGGDDILLDGDLAPQSRWDDADWKWE